MKALRIHEFGGVDVLSWEEVDQPKPRPHQVLIKVDSAGVNYADVMRRQGGHSGGSLPTTLGIESAGVIAEVGDAVTWLTVGQRVMAMGPAGQAEYAVVHAGFVFPYPETINPVHAGGMPVVLLTSYHTLKTRGQMQPGETVLIQAGASGVGSVAIQMAKSWGARVITTASTDEKLELARSLGADITINYTRQDFEEEVLKETEGEGAALVLESVGGEVLEKSIRCIAANGRLITYGNSSGQPANLISDEITPANRTVIGLSMSRSPVGSLDHKSAMAELMPMVVNGQINLVVDQILPMSEAGQAHEHVSQRGTRGKVILTP